MKWDPERFREGREEYKKQTSISRLVFSIAITDSFFKRHGLGSRPSPQRRHALGQDPAKYHPRLRPGHVQMERLRCERAAQPPLRPPDDRVERAGPRLTPGSLLQVSIFDNLTVPNKLLNPPDSHPVRRQQPLFRRRTKKNQCTLTCFSSCPQNICDHRSDAPYTTSCHIYLSLGS